MVSITYRIFLKIIMALLVIGCLGPKANANSDLMPFTPGEKLKFQLRWENVPAGSAWLEVHPIKTINGQQVYHFVMKAKSNAFVDIFYKVRDRIDAYADIEMTRSVHYEKDNHEGKHEKKETIAFDWENSRAVYHKHDEKKKKSLPLLDGSFDPLSAFYYTRTMEFDVGHQLERPVTDGRKNVVGRMRVVGRQTITLQNGNKYDTFLVEPDMKDVGGVFEKSDDSKIQLWVTADDKRIPVKIQSKVIVGHFIGELVAAKGVEGREKKILSKKAP